MATIRVKTIVCFVVLVCSTCRLVGFGWIACAPGRNFLTAQRHSVATNTNKNYFSEAGADII